MPSLVVIGPQIKEKQRGGHNVIFRFFIFIAWVWRDMFIFIAWV